MTQIQACTHKNAHVGLDAAYCPDCRQEFPQWSKEYVRLLNQDTRVFAVSSAECPAYAVEGLQKPDSTTIFELPSSWKQIPIAEPSSPDTTPAPPATPTSEPSPQSEESSIAWQEDRRARELVEPIPEVQDLMTNAQDYGEKCGALSMSAVPDLLSGKMSPPPDTQNQDNECLPSEEFCGILPASGIAENGSLSAQLSVERHTCANGCFLLPTPMAHSRASDKYRTPGQDKLEQKLRQVGAIPPGHVSHPALREWMLGLPDGWTDITVPDGGPPMNSPPQLASPNVVYPTEQLELPLSEIVAQPNRPQSCGEGLRTSLNFFKPGTLVWSDRTVDGKGIVRMTGTVIGNTVRSIKLDSLSDLPPIDTVLVRVRWDGNTSDSLISPAQLQVLKEPTIMIALAPNQTLEQPATHPRLGYIPNDSDASVLTEPKPQPVQALPSAESMPESEPESVPVDAIKELPSPTESNITKSPKPLEPPEEGVQSTDDTLTKAPLDGEVCLEELLNTADTQSQNHTEGHPDAQPEEVERDFSLEELARAINRSHQLYQDSYKSSLLHAQRTGEFLLKAKAKVKESTSGRWLPWLEENCHDISERTARAYMQVARSWEQIEKSATVADFGLKGALKLLSEKKVSYQQSATPASAKDVLDALEIEVLPHQQPERVNFTTTLIEGSAIPPKERDYVVVANDHPLFPGQRGRVMSRQNLDSAIVALDEGTYEQISIRYLQPEVTLLPEDSEIGAGSDSGKCGLSMQTELTLVEDELKQKASQLGLRFSGEQVRPDVKPNHSKSADVDERPNAFPAPISINTDEICTTFIGSIEYMNHEHLAATVDALAQRTSPKTLDLMGDTELLRLVNKFSLLAKRAKALLNKRHNPSYFNSQSSRR